MLIFTHQPMRESLQQKYYKEQEHMRKNFKSEFSAEIKQECKLFRSIYQIKMDWNLMDNNHHWHIQAKQKEQKNPKEQISYIKFEHGPNEQNTQTLT